MIRACHCSVWLVCLLVVQFGISVHEIGHSLGMWHEHMRSDRDDYVRINWENMMPEESAKNNFMKMDTLNLAEYNYGSVMHYPPGVYLLESHAIAERTARRCCKFRYM